MTKICPENPKDGIPDGANTGGAYTLESNRLVAEKLRQFADLLHQQGEDGFRQQAYRNAADAVAGLSHSVSDILAVKGRKGLVALPAIGNSIAGAIAEMVLTGRWAQLERLSGDLLPERLFMTIPGIGPVLAYHLVEDAHLETLEDLESAIHRPDFYVRGIGPRRKKAISAVLAERLGRPVFRHTSEASSAPPVEMILTVDAMYRERAKADTLPKIAPKRFNPTGKQWLPILHARHDDWHFTALFSNTSRAHTLAKTDDWVVIAFQNDRSPEGRCTVVTETHGPLCGQRVVRGREKEMLALSRQRADSEERRHMLT